MHALLGKTFKFALSPRWSARVCSKGIEREWEWKWNFSRIFSLSLPLSYSLCIKVTSKEEATVFAKRTWWVGNERKKNRVGRAWKKNLLQSVFEDFLRFESWSSLFFLLLRIIGWLWRGASLVIRGRGLHAILFLHCILTILTGSKWVHFGPNATAGGSWPNKKMRPADRNVSLTPVNESGGHVFKTKGPSSSPLPSIL